MTHDGGGGWNLTIKEKHICDFLRRIKLFVIQQRKTIETIEWNFKKNITLNACPRWWLPLLFCLEIVLFFVVKNKFTQNKHRTEHTNSESNNPFIDNKNAILNQPNSHHCKNKPNLYSPSQQKKSILAKYMWYSVAGNIAFKPEKLVSRNVIPPSDWRKQTSRKQSARYTYKV